MDKTTRTINGETLRGWDIQLEELKKVVPFDNWDQFNIGSEISIILGIRKNPKNILTTFASGSSIPTVTGVVFGICEAREDGNLIDRDHIIGYLIDKNTVFLTPDKDKNKKHNYGDLEELKQDIKLNPPHEKD